MKTCKTCGRSLPLDAFPVARNGNGDLFRRGRCHNCHRAYYRQYERTYRARCKAAGKPAHGGNCTREQRMRRHFRRLMAGVRLEKE